MSDPWKVVNPTVDDFHLLMRAALKRCKEIIDGVDATLRPIHAAVQAKGMPLWDGLQKSWRGHYVVMDGRLQGTAGAGVDAHEAIKWGDNQSVRIMSY